MESQGKRGRTLTRDSDGWWAGRSRNSEGLLPGLPPEPLELSEEAGDDVGVVKDDQVLVVGDLGALGPVVRPGGHESLVEDGELVVHEGFSVRVEPSYLSKVERGLVPPPSEAKINLLAKALGEDPDVLPALAGKVSQDLQAVVWKRPTGFAELLQNPSSPWALQ